MKKKHLYIVIAVILVVGLSAAALYASGDELAYSLNAGGNGYIVTGIGSCKDKDIVIPDTYEGLPVKEIATRAFEQKKDITSVVIPDSVTKMGDFVFSGCTKLNSVDLSSNLISMGKGAFYNCTSLGSVSLPTGLSVIGDWAFWNCMNITEIYLPSTISSVGIGAFSGCTNLSVVNLNSGISSLSQYLFADCISLSSITLPSNVTTINEYAFADCSNLSEIFFGNSHVNINSKAFYGVTSNARYSCTNESWNGFNFSGYGGNLTWISHSNVAHFPAVEATETSPGSIEYWQCQDCGKYFSDSVCTNEISASQIVTPIIGDAIRGDVDGNGKKDGDDVLRALYHLFYPDVYKVNQGLDFNGDGKENGDDVLRLLYNLFYEDVYPLL